MIDETAVATAVPAAQRRLGALVHEPVLADVSDVDRTFLLAMAQDDGPSRVSDIAARLGVDANYTNRYRRRLLDAQLIAAPRRGLVDFEVPYLREYLREHGALDAQRSLHEPTTPQLGQPGPALDL